MCEHYTYAAIFMAALNGLVENDHSEAGCSPMGWIPLTFRSTS